MSRKKLGILLLNLAACTAFAQRNKPAKMEALFADAYYVSSRGDTVKGELQINPEKETEFYRQFAFRSKGSKKPRLIGCQKAMAYGFGDRNFIRREVEGSMQFLERLVSGRLTLYEYCYPGEENGNPAIRSSYFIEDKSNEQGSGQQQMTRISRKFYKRSLKPYLNEHPSIWNRLDKFHFSETDLVAAISEFNGYYANSAYGRLE
jgi:hypothetical protein